MNRIVTRVLFCLVVLALTVPAFAQSNERGIDLRNIDESTPPCQDFDQYANGTWMKNNPIPEEHTAWGT